MDTKVDIGRVYNLSKATMCVGDRTEAYMLMKYKHLHTFFFPGLSVVYRMCSISFTLAALRFVAFACLLSSLTDGSWQRGSTA